MLKTLKFVGLTSAAVFTFSLAARATTYSGNGSNGFAGGTTPGPLGGSTLTVTNNSSGLITFSLATPGGFGNNIAFYFSTGATGISNTSSLTDIGDSGRRAITGDGTSAGPSLVNFPTGFRPSFAVAIDGAGNGNLFAIPTAAGNNGILTYLQGANYSIANNPTYTFSLNATAFGLQAANGVTLSFVATLGNGSDGANNNNYYRSNETIGASNADNNATGNLGNTGTLTYTGFDTYTLTGIAVPEPSSTLSIIIVAAGVGMWFAARRRRA